MISVTFHVFAFVADEERAMV